MCKEGSNYIRTWGIGESEDWKEMDLPDNGYFVELQASYSMRFGIDNNGRLFVWGENLDDDFPKPEDSDKSDCFLNRDKTKPSHLKWFSDKDLKVLDVQVGQKFAVALTQDSQGKKYLYGLGKQINESYNGKDNVFPNRFGQNSKAVYETYIHEITDVDAE